MDMDRIWIMGSWRWSSMLKCIKDGRADVWNNMAGSVKDYYALKEVVETVHQQNVHSGSLTFS